MNKYLIFCLLLVSSCQMHKTIRQEDFLWETVKDEIGMYDSISIEEEKVWLCKLRGGKSYLIDKKTGFFIDSIGKSLSFTGELYLQPWNIERKGKISESVLRIYAPEKFKYKVYFLVQFPLFNRHGSATHTLGIQNKQARHLKRFNMPHDLFLGIQDIRAMDSSLLLIKFTSRNKDGNSIALINLDSLMKRKK